MPNSENTNNERIIQVDIESQMKKSFIDYAMSVIAVLSRYTGEYFMQCL